MTHNSTPLRYLILDVVKPNTSSKWAWKSKKTTDRPIF